MSIKNHSLAKENRSSRQSRCVATSYLYAGADVGGGCRGCAPPPPDMTCGFLIQLVFFKKKKTMWFIGVEVEQETSAPHPKKNPGSAPGTCTISKHDSSNLSWKVCKSCVTVPASQRSREQPVIYSRDVLQPSKYLIVNRGKLN